MGARTRKTTQKDYGPIEGVSACRGAALERSPPSSAARRRSRRAHFCESTVGGHVGEYSVVRRRPERHQRTRAWSSLRDPSRHRLTEEEASLDGFGRHGCPPAGGMPQPMPRICAATSCLACGQFPGGGGTRPTPWRSGSSRTPDGSARRLIGPGSWSAHTSTARPIRDSTGSGSPASATALSRRFTTPPHRPRTPHGHPSGAEDGRCPAADDPAHASPRAPKAQAWRAPLPSLHDRRSRTRTRP